MLFISGIVKAPVVATFADVLPEIVPIRVEDVAQFYLTLGNAGYLENRFEVNLIAVEM